MTPGMDRPATDAALTTGTWIVGERYLVRDGIDRVDTALGAWLPLRGNPVWAVQERDGSLFWMEQGAGGQWRTIPDRARQLCPLERRVRVIVDESPDPRTRAPKVWAPGGRAGLADELVRLGQHDEAAIVGWVKEHGFVGVRANPREGQESVEEIRYALACLRQARDLVRAIRELKGDALRAETERLLTLPPGLLESVSRDRTATYIDEETGPHETEVQRERQPMWGVNLARAFGIAVPKGAKWPEAGAHIQALYGLSAVLGAPLERFLRVQATIAPTGDGMRLQGAIVAQGPLATAYLQTLDEASWPAITYVGSLLRVDWHAPRRCGRCGTTFRPSRPDRKWCSKRCLWAASKARAAGRPSA